MSDSELDLDRLGKVYKRYSCDSSVLEQGTSDSSRHQIKVRTPDRRFHWIGEMDYEEDAKVIVSIVNAFPAMIARIRELEEANEHLSERADKAEKALRKLVNACRVRKVDRDWIIFESWFTRIDREIGVGNGRGDLVEDEEAGR